MENIVLKVKNFIEDENGVTAIEYGLLAALIAVAIVTAAGSVGDNLKNVFMKIAAALA